MIILTRLGGHDLAVNPDLIERAEPTPDTVITMVDGHKLIVAESVQEVIERIRAWRASVAAEAFALSHEAAEDDASGEAGPDAASHLRGLRSTQEVTAHSAIDSSLARVLRMPQREG